MDREIAGLKELITQRFDSVDERIDALTSQVRETNGRLRMAESAIADFRPRVRTLEREVGEVRADSSGENRAIKAWHVFYGLACIAMTVAVLKFFGRL
jgi:predicted  nucleic acid-binding Zn-ribbon protein